MNTFNKVLIEQRPTYHCFRCGSDWKSRIKYNLELIKKPKLCPKCKSKYWFYEIVGGQNDNK